MTKFFTERGQGLVEYALVLLLVAIVVIIAVTALGTKTSSIFADVSNNISSLVSVVPMV